MHANLELFLKNSLNDEQKKVVEPQNGIHLVCAGAGSGKTRVITARIAYLISKHNIPAESIVALTFTNKAAREMKERVVSFIGSESVPYVGTFHSYCLKLLKKYSGLLNLQQFSIIDSSDQEKLVRSLINKFGLNKKITCKNIISLVSKVKNEAVTKAEREKFYEYDPLFKQIYQAYEQEKSVAQCLDFDDLIVKTLELFQTNKFFKETFQNQIKHVLIDEYQDTNKIQHELLKEMANLGHKNFVLDSLCIVGDEDQSIYSWRGANVSNIINFNKDFINTKLVTIEQNYRSVQPILTTANTLIKNNSFRNEKKLWSNRNANDRVRLMEFTSGYQEAQALAMFIKKIKNLDSCAILYRSHFQSRSIEEALIRNSVPYKIIGGVQFYDRLEIKDLMGYLRLISNPYDRIAFSRVINCPTRGLGEKFEEIFYNLWDNQPFSKFYEIVQQLLDSKTLNKTQTSGIKSFIEIFQDLKSSDKPSIILESIIKRTNYYQYLKDSFDPTEYETKKDNVKEFLNGVNYFEDQNQNANLDIFLEEIALFQDQINTAIDDNECVKLMTLHAAKGLEFDTVVLAGLEDGVLPSTHSLYEPERLEEERRLLYVGITRAKERVLITYAKCRYTFGQMSEQKASRFIAELPQDIIQFTKCDFWNNYQFEIYFSDWLKK